MIGAVDLGERRVHDLIGKYGKEVLVRTCQDLMDYSERRMRAEIEQIPDGIYDFEDLIERAFLEGQISGEAMELAYHCIENSPQSNSPH